MNKKPIFELRDRIIKYKTLDDLTNKLRDKIRKDGNKQFKDGFDYIIKVKYLKKLFENVDEINDLLILKHYLNKWNNKAKKLKKRDNKLKKGMNEIEKRQLINDTNTIADAELIKQLLNSIPVARAYDFFDKFNDRSQFKKDELQELGIPLDLIRKYAGKETEKMFTNVDFESFVRVAINYLTAHPRKLSEQIKAQTEYLGYITIADDRYSRMAAVISVDTKYSPRLKMYSLKNGTTLDCKIDKKSFNKEKLAIGDIVRINGTKQKPKVRKNEETGEWESIPGTNELWITTYHKLNDL